MKCKTGEHRNLEGKKKKRLKTKFALLTWETERTDDASRARYWKKEKQRDRERWRERGELW